MIVAGFGFRSKAGTASLRAAYDRARGELQPQALATLDAKAEGLRALARTLDLPVIAVPAEASKAIETPTRSAASLAAHGTGSVAEASALAAAGGGARLLVGRVTSPDGCATCALAEGEGP